MNTTPIKNAFFWQGKSETLDKFGRMKTQRQILLDGTRVNPESNIARSTVGACDRDGARRAMKEMNAQTLARQAAKASCFFVAKGDADRLEMANA